MDTPTTEPAKPLTADEKRAATGVTIVALNLHRYLTARPTIDKKRVLGDVAFLQESLVNWTDDGTLVGKIIKQLVECVIAMAAKDKRLA